MKIQDQVRVNLGDPRHSVNERASANNTSFQQIMNSRTKEITQDHFQKLLNEIDQQGKQLSENPNFRELGKYKNLVQKFIEEATQKGVGLYQTDSWDPYGGNRTLKTVKVLDQQLIDLTNQVLHEHNNGLEILARIGEIKGLLINLYR